MTLQTTQEAYNPAVFRLHRQRRGWTQAEAGRKVRHHQTWWSALENGRLRPTTTDLERIAAAFSITVKTLARQLYGGNGRQSDPAD